MKQIKRFFIGRWESDFNLISPKDTDKEHVMHLKSDKIEIMIYDKADEVFQERFESPLCRY